MPCNEAPFCICACKMLTIDSNVPIVSPLFGAAAVTVVLSMRTRTTADISQHTMPPFAIVSTSNGQVQLTSFAIIYNTYEVQHSPLLRSYTQFKRSCVYRIYILSMSSKMEELWNIKLSVNSFGFNGMALSPLDAFVCGWRGMFTNEKHADWSTGMPPWHWRHSPLSYLSHTRSRHAGLHHANLTLTNCDCSRDKRNSFCFIFFYIPIVRPLRCIAVLNYLFCCWHAADLYFFFAL